MERLWESDIQLVVAGDFLYLPLLLDPAIVRELESRPPGKLSASDRQASDNPAVVEAQGSLFVRTVSLASLVENYAVIQPEVCEGLRRALREEVGDFGDPGTAVLDPDLAVILFQVLPHFLRRSRSFSVREALDEDKVLRAIRDKVQVPPQYARRACSPDNRADLQEALAKLANLARSPGPPPTGVMPAGRLKVWFFQALKAVLATREKRRLEEAAAVQENWAAICRRHADLLAYLAEKGSLELDGFGFARRRPREYVIYKRTGRYALKDYYGRPYIFPDCRVAVSTSGRLKPFVMDNYKHPLLRRHAPGQEICLPKDFKPALRFSAAGAIQALEAGINALYYGYNPRRRNGYHSLDRTQQVRVVDFDDYKVPPDDPRLVSGEVEVKNIFF